MDFLKGIGCLLVSFAAARFAWRQHRSPLPPLGLYHPLPMPFLGYGLFVPLAATFFSTYVETSPLRYVLYAIMLSGLFVGLFGFVLHGMFIFGWFPKPGSWMYPGYGTQELMQQRPREQRGNRQARSVRARRKRSRRDG